MRKTISIISLCFILFFNTIPVYAASDISEANTQEYVELSKDEVQQGIGITVIQFIDQNGDTVQYQFEEKTSDYLKREQSADTARDGFLSTFGYGDGVQELVIVHLSAINWTGTSLHVQFYGHSDEILINIAGTWYCKSTAGAAYWSSYMTIPFMSYLNTVTTTLARVNVGSATTVRLGFSNVTFKNIYGYAGSMSPSWSNVKKP